MTSQPLELAIFKKYYDVARVIDPQTAVFSQPANCKTPQHLWDCYYAGQSANKCKPCVCLQAIQQKETSIRIEVQQGIFFLITAIPLEVDGHTAALELIQGLTEKASASFLPLAETRTNLYHSLIKLNDLATKDALTNIYNRRYIDEQLPYELSQAQNQHYPFSIMMADIDYFKQINDHYGHLIGDEVLRLFATYLKDNIRQDAGDWVARYGGDEFLIILNNCPEYPAYKVAEKIRKFIAQTPFSTSAGMLHITASFGVHTSSGQEGALPQLFSKVDIQLYYAKQAGRNSTASTAINN